MKTFEEYKRWNWQRMSLWQKIKWIWYGIELFLFDKEYKELKRKIEKDGLKKVLNDKQL
jgi:ABC-type uncharacterized transport system permease subunit